MIKYKVTFYIKSAPQASITIEAMGEDSLRWFIYNFYPDCNYDWEILK